MNNLILIALQTSLMTLLAVSAIGNASNSVNASNAVNGDNTPTNATQVIQTSKDTKDNVSLTLYTSKTCLACHLAKKSLDGNCIKYKVVELGPNNPYKIDAVPVLDIKGKQNGTPVSLRLLGFEPIHNWALQHKACK